MNTSLSLPASPASVRALLNYLEETGSPVDLTAIADEAILDWIARQREGAARCAPVRGYQWKCLFLPEGTLLRVWCRSELGYAEVVGDRLLHGGEPTTPNRFVTQFAGTVRNAWAVSSVLMPGERTWKLASVRRREILRAPGCGYVVQPGVPRSRREHGHDTPDPARCGPGRRMFFRPFDGRCRRSPGRRPRPVGVYARCRSCRSRASLRAADEPRRPSQ